MLEGENHYFTTSNEIMELGSNHLGMQKSLGEIGALSWRLSLTTL